MKVRAIHPFPARMAPEIALRSLEVLPRNSLVLDPMVGSGTVVRQALALGHRAIGFDMDPLAILMSRVWTSPVDPQSVGEELESLITESEAIDLRTTRLDWHDSETATFVRFWFATSQRRTLTRLAAVLARRRRVGQRRLARGSAVDVLQVALSRIIVTKEQCASLARDTSHSRPHRVVDDNEYDVVAGLRRSTLSLLERLRDHTLKRKARIALGDARALALRTGSVDYILTSPPYLNQIDYMRGHRLSLVWFGYSLAELQAIRRNAIGAERASNRNDIHHNIEPIVRSMCRTDELSSRHRNMVLRYATDLRRLLAESARVLAPAGRAVFVVGNSRLRDQFIYNADGVAQAARLAGLRTIARQERELPNASRYLPLTADGTLSKRMRTETILTFAPA
jgi:SAM-dependent methyltransferase